MGDDELFAAMGDLEGESEALSPDKRDGSDVFARIALVETAIEDRFPGQLLTPYKEWQKRQNDI
ncbi:hypothetical protein CPY51_06055 [Rhizobium tubonense]|uniref:Uncharacterized protein n=2 Tax=Rhizobium tubonense TaxID=484088 RepID=A0A2W4CT15_9HYPH|nr:hypothetical protein [Rhizobium tubonense]PZM15767.1 hypothetical protein CPY51_06055 [Rhizobium tubonense]